MVLGDIGHSWQWQPSTILSSCVAGCWPPLNGILKIAIKSGELKTTSLEQHGRGGSRPAAAAYLWWCGQDPKGAQSCFKDTSSALCFTTVSKHLHIYSSINVARQESARAWYRFRFRQQLLQSQMEILWRRFWHIISACTNPLVMWFAFRSWSKLFWPESKRERPILLRVLQPGIRHATYASMGHQRVTGGKKKKRRKATGSSQLCRAEDQTNGTQLLKRQIRN